MTKTAEEKAREYAIKRHGTHIAFEPDRFESRVAYLSGYHSRDEEVKELREALSALLILSELLIDGLDAWDIEYPEIEQAKQLLNKE